MINKKDLLNNKDFYKSFKNGEDLTSFFKQLHKRAVEYILEAELDAHLDNEKHKKLPLETIATDTEQRR
jgi:transposase-like protein